MKKKIIFIIILQLTVLYAHDKKIIPYCLNNQIGFIDESFNILIEPCFESLEQWDDNSFILYTPNRKNQVLYNKYGRRNVMNPILLGDGYYSSYKGNDTVIYNEEGKSIRWLPDLQHDHKSTYNYMIVFNMGKEDIITTDGSYLFNDDKIREIYNYDPKTGTALCRYSSKGYCLISKNSIKNKDDFLFGMRSFNDGLVFGKNTETGESGFYDMDCKLIIKADILSTSDMDDWNLFPSISNDALSFVQENNSKLFLSQYQVYHSSNWIITDKKGKILADGITADHIYPFSDNVAVYKIKTNGSYKYGLINKNGENLTTTLYDNLESSVNGYCMAKNNNVDYLISSADGTVYRCDTFK